MYPVMGDGDLVFFERLCAFHKIIPSISSLFSDRTRFGLAIIHTYQSCATADMRVGTLCILFRELGTFCVDLPGYVV